MFSENRFIGIFKRQINSRAEPEFPEISRLLKKSFYKITL